MDYKEFYELWRDDNPYIECHTSGSTGKPKRIMLPKREMVRSAMRTIRYFNIDSNSRLHSCISPDYIGGRMMAVRSILAGCRLTWEAPSNRPLGDMLGENIDLLAVVPSQMIHILDNIGEMPSIKNIIIGGAPIPNPLRERIIDSGLNCVETYGMTETASHIALSPIKSMTPKFHPLEGIFVEADRESRLVIDILGWQKITTNDIIEIDDDGSFTILGRYDNVIISGGKKVQPEEVERILEAALGCEVLLTSEPDLKWGERVWLIVEKGRCEYSEEEIDSICRRLLKPEAIPKRITFDYIPHNNGKKIRRNIQL